MTKAQETLFNEIKLKLNEIKNSNYIENWYNENQKRFYNSFNDFCNDSSESAMFPFLKKLQRKAIEENIVSIRANSKTLKSLESLGLIKILEIGGSFHDDVKVL